MPKQPEPPSQRETVALSWLGNPIVIYGGSALVIIGAIYFFAPSVFSKGKEWFNGWVDTVRGGIGDVIGTPSSQVPSERSGWDSFTGLFSTNDRALSDAVDSAFGWLSEGG